MSGPVHTSPCPACRHDVPAGRWSPEPPGERVEVICSDLSVRSVPVDLLTTDEPGELVELANGTCVVMDPNGVVTP